MKIYHLYHSGIAVSDQNRLFVFDYYKDRLDGSKLTGEADMGLKQGVIRKQVLKDYEDIYVFVSHNHSDHYNPVIFEWENYNSNIKYILSDDIKSRDNNRGNIYFVGKDEQKSIGDINITTYGSTDQGISFLLNIDNSLVFHSGDLNWWYWDSFSKEQLQQEEDDFKYEVDKLKGKKIDIAFVPIDPRLKKNYYFAGEYFLKTIKPSLFVPIHFGDSFHITKKFAEKFSDLNTDIAIIKKRGEEIIY